MQDRSYLSRRLRSYRKRGIIQRPGPSRKESLGHLEKAGHNLDFVQDNIPLGYLDWCVAGIYYALYHAALALLASRGYRSKDHTATLCLLIKDFTRKDIRGDDLELLDSLHLSYSDLLTYTQVRKRRREASYSTRYLFDIDNIRELRNDSVRFIQKAKAILADAG